MSVELSSARLTLLYLALAGPVLSALEASFFHGRTRFAHPAMWLPAAYGILHLGLGLPYVLYPSLGLTRMSYYFLYWVGLVVGFSGFAWHQREELRTLRAVAHSRYRRLAVGPPPLAPLAFVLYSVLGLLAFHLA